MEKDQEIAEKIKRTLELMMSGDSLQKALCETDLSAYMFGKWVNLDPKLQTDYARARQIRADFLVEEIVFIADNEDDAQKARNRMDARKWYASKMQPSVYGDRLNLEVTSFVDIAGALEDAKSRSTQALLPNCYLTTHEKIQDAELISDDHERTTGLQSVAHEDASIEGHMEKSASEVRSKK